jgi:SOS-response transcriptional repressor LexA
VKSLTPRQRDVLEFIRSFTADHGWPPTYRQIGAHFGFRSAAGAGDHLRRLCKKGYLESVPFKSRALRVVGGAVDIAALPRRYPPRTAGAIAVVVRPVESEPVRLMWLGQIHDGRLVAA